MGQPIIQNAFSAGEFSPALYARTDINKYHVGAAYLRNFFVDVRGGASNRPGQAFIGPASDQAHRSRLIPFQFSITQAYALLFGHQQMMVIKNGSVVLNAGKSISAVTNANPAVVTANAHGFSNGNFVFLQNVGGMTTINGTWFKVAGATANTFQLTDLFGNNIDTTNTTLFPAYTSGGTASTPFVLATPYNASDLPLLKYTQSADTMTLTHTSYAPQYLTRSADNAWTITPVTFAAAQAAPSITSVTHTNTGTTSYTYVITAISAASSEESLASASGQTTTSATMSQTAGASVTVNWNAPAGPAPKQYKVYREQEVPGGAAPAGSFFGFVGTTPVTSFTDVNIAPDFTNTPPTGQNPFAGNNNPGSCCYFQQRQCFAGSSANPENFWMSQPGNFNNFNTHLPSQSSDAITATIATQQVNAVKFLVPMNSLIAPTASGAFQITGGGQIGVGITPSNVSAQPQAYNGCADVQPLPINQDILYVQSKGSIVRDLQYNFYVNLYTGVDMTVFSKHLFFGHQIQEWCWAEEPFKTVWAVREDGLLLGFAYLKEQDIYGWSHHDTGQQIITLPSGQAVASGSDHYLSVCSVPETAGPSPSDAVYFLVQRNINGNTLYCVERQDGRNFGTDVRLGFFVDCGLKYPLTFLNATLSFTGSNVQTGAYVLNADNSVFTSGMVGNIVRANNGIFTITQFISGTQVQASSQRVPMYDLESSPTAPPLINLSSVSPNSWSCTAPVQIIAGLNHLEGMSASILVDGGVQPPQIVTKGTVTLQQPGTDIIIGLPFQAQLQTLYADTGQPTIQGKRKKIDRIVTRLMNTRGLKAGPKFGSLVAFKERGNQIFGLPVDVITGDEGPNIMPPLWNKEGQICYQQDNPLPTTILGVIPFLNLGDTP